MQKKKKGRNHARKMRYKVPGAKMIGKKKKKKILAASSESFCA